MKQDRLMFEHTIEGLLRSIGSRMTPRLEQRLREAGLDVRKKRLPAYSFEAWRAFLRIVREELYGSSSEREGYRRFGADLTRAYFETTLGAAVAGMVRLLGPVRTLKRATQNFRSANNFTDTRVQELGPNHWELWMNVVDQNDFNVGLLQHALERAGARGIEVEIQPDEVGEGVRFLIRWS